MFANASGFSGAGGQDGGGGQFTGFVTGKGKPVQLSAAAIARAKAIFKDENLQPATVSQSSLPPPGPSASVEATTHVTGFQTDEEVEGRQGDDEEVERELSPILDPRQLEFFPSTSKSSIARRNLSSEFAIAPGASASTPVSRFVTDDGRKEIDPKVLRMFSNIRSLTRGISANPSPKRTKLADRLDFSGYTQEVSDLTNDFMADEEKCELLEEDSFFISSSMIPTLVSSAVIHCRESGRLAQMNTVRQRLNEITPREGFLKQFRNTNKIRRIKLGNHVGLGLPKQYSKDELLSCNVKESVIEINLLNAASFRFDGVEFFGKEITLTNEEGLVLGDDVVLIFGYDCALGVKEFANGFMSNSAVDPALISFEWLRNHYKWIVWTLANYEKKFPRQFGGRTVTPTNVLFRLKYRYDREIDNSERSALRRILEQDDNPRKRMILFVSNIFDPEDDADSTSEGDDDGAKRVANLELSDGWYSVDCICDSTFSSFIKKGLVTIGTKLILHGAELIASEPMHPLEAKGKAFIKFGSNSVRRARWNSRLGFCDDSSAFPIPVSSVITNGGLIPLLHLTIVKVDPITYHCKIDGKSVLYQQQQYDKFQRENEIKKEIQMEKLYEEAKKEIEITLNKPKTVCKLKVIGQDELENMSVVNVLDLMEEFAEDANAIQFMLSKRKMDQVKAAQQKRQEEIQIAIHRKVEEKMARLNSNTEPNGVPFVQIRVLDASIPLDQAADNRNSALLSIWRPQEDLLNCLSEGLSFKVFSLMPSNCEYVSRRITATRSTKFVPLLLQNK